MADVTVYTTESCPFCMRAKAFLDQRGVQYDEVFISRSDHAARERLLFLRLLLEARESVTLSWRLKKEGDREAMPKARGPRDDRVHRVCYAAISSRRT